MHKSHSEKDILGQLPMKPDTVYKGALNATLQLLGNGEFAAGMPSENQLRGQIGVSRTTVRKVLRELTTRGIVVQEDGANVPGRPGRQG